MQINSHLSVLIHDLAKKYGGRTALEYKDYGGTQWKHVSWNEFSNQVTRVSEALLALGVGVQEKIAVFSQNSIHYLLQTSEHGACVPAPFLSTPQQARRQCSTSSTRRRYATSSAVSRNSTTKHAMCRTYAHHS